MKREELLVNCIDDIQAGKSGLDECISRYPEIATELKELFGILKELRPETIVPSIEFKRRVRNHLIAVMDATEASRRPTRSWLPSFSPRKLSYTVALCSLVLTMLSGSTVLAAQNSLPGDRLYPVKTGVEEIQLALTRAPETKVTLSLMLADRRMKEVVEESASGREISPSALQAIATRIDSAVLNINNLPEDQGQPLLNQLSQATVDHQAKLEEMSKVAPEHAQPALKQAIEVARRGHLIAQVAEGNSSFLGTGASVFDERLESDYFEIEGTIVGIDGRTWDVGGIQLKEVNTRDVSPLIGSGVVLHGIVRNSEVFISKVERREKAAADVTVKGIFSGTSSGGTVWSIGGLYVGEFHDVTPPTPGKQVEFTGKIQNGIFTLRDTKSGKNIETTSGGGQTTAGSKDGQEDIRNAEDSRNDPISSRDTEDRKDRAADSRTAGDSGDRSGDNRNAIENKDRPGNNTSSGESGNRPGDNRTAGDSGDRSGDNRNAIENKDRPGDGRSSDESGDRPADSRNTGDSKDRSPDNRSTGNGKENSSDSRGSGESGNRPGDSRSASENKDRPGDSRGSSDGKESKGEGQKTGDGKGQSRESGNSGSSQSRSGDSGSRSRDR